MRTPALLLVLLSAGAGFGQCARTSACYPVQQTYLTTPTYSYQTYASPYYTPHLNQYSYTAVVGQAYPVYLPLLSYTALSDDVRGYYSTKRASKDGFLEALREAAAEGIIGSPYTRPGVEPPVTQPQPQPQPGTGPSSPPPNPTPPVPEHQQPQSHAAPKGKVQVAKVLTSRCATCHNPQTEPNHIDLSRAPDTIRGEERALCVLYVTDGSMPKGKGPIPQEEYDALVAWAKAAPIQFAKSIPPAQPAKK